VIDMEVMGTVKMKCMAVEVIKFRGSMSKRKCHPRSYEITLMRFHILCKVSFLNQSTDYYTTVQTIERSGAA
jgi:hypothetical protein